MILARFHTRFVAGAQKEMMSRPFEKINRIFLYLEATQQMKGDWLQIDIL